MPNNAFVYKQLILQNLSRDQPVVQAWQKLASQQQAPVFSTAEWALAYQTAFPPRKIALFWAEQDNQMVALLPLFQKNRRLWESPGGLNADQHVPLSCLPIAQGLFVHEALVQAAQRHIGSWQKISWPHLPLSDPLSAALWARSPELHATIPRTGCCPLLDFSEKGWNTASDHLSHLPKKRRDDIKRLRNRARKEGALTYERLTDPEQVKTILPDFFKCHSAQKKAQGKKAHFEKKAFRHLALAWFQEIPSDVLHFSILKWNDTPIHYHLGWLINGYVGWYLPTYVLAYAHLNPGTLHLDMLIAHALHERLLGIDFLQGDEPYKYQWGSSDRFTFNWLLPHSRSQNPS